MNHRNGSCPVCKKKFKDGDDIVTCPSCGASYHRECYHKEGQCIFTDKHGSGFEYKSPESIEAAKEAYSHTFEPPAGTGAGIVCSNCGTANDSRNIFCEKCGNPLYTKAAQGTANSSAPPNFSPLNNGGMAYAFPGMAIDLSGEIDGISKKDWAAYIGNSAFSYIMRMDSQQRRESKLSFMVSVFFAGPFYFAYRKIWGWAVVTFLIQLALMVPLILFILAKINSPLAVSLSLDTLQSLTSTAAFASMVFNTLLAIFSLYIFRKSSGKKILALKERYSDANEYQAQLVRSGGTSIMGVILFICIQFALTFIFGMLLGQDQLAMFTDALWKYTTSS